MENDDQGQGERQVPHKGSNRRVEHGQRGYSDGTQNCIDDPISAKHYLPGVDAHQIAGEEGNDEEEYGPAAR